jgi:hypothetical protein
LSEFGLDLAKNAIQAHGADGERRQMGSATWRAGGLLACLPRDSACICGDVRTRPVTRMRLKQPFSIDAT